MKKTMCRLIALSFLTIISCMTVQLYAQSKSKKGEQTKPLSYFKVYRGNTHAHTIFTWTHGAHREKSIKKIDKPTEFHPNFKVPAGMDWRYHKTISLNPEEYENLQGLPDNHYMLAMENGFDFYAITDHSQEPPLQPVSNDNPVWRYTQKSADQYNINGKFVTLPGFEYSRNTDENGGNGHINVLNSAEYVNADHGQRGMAPAWPDANWSVPQFYNWAKTAKAYQNKGSVVIGFNHPEPDQFNDWDNLDEEIVKKSAPLRYTPIIKSHVGKLISEL